MKKILILSPHPEWGGSATANITIAKMLANVGFDVVYNDEYSEFTNYNNVKISHIPFHREKQHRNRTLIEYVQKYQIDIVFWGVPQLFAFYQPALKYFKRSGIVQLTIFHSLSLTNGIRGKLSEWISAYSVKMMNHIVFVSEFTMNSWAKYFHFRKSQNKSHIIYNAISFSSDTHIVKDKENISIGFVGRFSIEKQPELFCELSKSYNGNSIAYGDGPLLHYCKNKYTNVDYRGLVKNQDELYEDVDILVMTSKFENCPMVVLEAMSRGIPCIAPNVGGIPEIIKSGCNGMLYDVYDKNEILLTIEKIKRDYKTFSNNCINISRKYSQEFIEKEWYKLLQEALV